MRSISPVTAFAACNSSSPMAEKRRRLPTRWKISTAIRRSLSLMWWLRADWVMPRASAARVREPCRSMATSMRNSLTSSPVAMASLYMRNPHELAMDYEFLPEPALRYLWTPSVEEGMDGSGARSIRLIENTYIHMSDGVRVAAKIWLPEDAERHPVPAILEMIPYR